jgi:hypothetical protein
MKRVGLSLSAALFVGTLATEARAAQVHINLHFGAPPPIFLHSAPTLVYLPQPAVYVAVGVPYDLYYAGGRYYYLRGNTWYWGPGYGGPWVHAASLPPGLRKYRVEHLREFRNVSLGKGKGRGKGRR